MCMVCGCNGDATNRPGHSYTHDHGDGHPHSHADDPELGVLHHGADAARAAAPAKNPERTIALERSVFDENNRCAGANRSHFAAHGVLALNLVSSPGSGKTTLLVETLRRLRVTTPSLATAVIEGDQQTSLDADRVRATGVAAIQINTGRGCHLDAAMVGDAFARLPLHDAGGVLFIENVGNLVCPALFDLGEAGKVVVLSVTEGEDKPLKYPDMFAAASLVLINKIDLLPYVSFDVERVLSYVRRVNPAAAVMPLSATTGQGFAPWLDWIVIGHAHQQAHRTGAAHAHADLPIAAPDAGTTEHAAPFAARG